MSEAVRKAIEALGKFENLRENQEGANAYAFIAHHKHLNEERFLKAIYLPEQDGDSVLREPQRLIAALNTKPVSKNVVRLHDADIIKVKGDDYVLLQMEYLTGSSLQKQIETRVFGQQESIRVAIQILQGVAQLHNQRLVHRDLKPANIIVHDGNVKIADFGSVSELLAGVDFVAPSKQSDFYMPAEVWGNPPRYTFLSDLYQVGLILYQMINGPFPPDGKRFLSKSVIARLRVDGKDYDTLGNFERVQAERDSLAELTSKEKLLSTALAPRAYYSPIIERLIRKVTRADMARRPNSAQELLHKLAQISTPDWKAKGDCFLAAGWKGWNWKVHQVKRKTGLQTIVERARPSSHSYRSCHQTSALAEAFRFVDDQA